MKREKKVLGTNLQFNIVATAMICLNFQLVCSSFTHRLQGNSVPSVRCSSRVQNPVGRIKNQSLMKTEILLYGRARGCVSL